MHLGGSDVIEHAPVIYQDINGSRRAVDGGYVHIADNRYGFAIGNYDSTRPLVIDPILLYSSYLGGSDEDVPTSSFVDRAGNIYLAGDTSSTDFPTANPFQSQHHGGTTINVGSDGFLMKLDPTGTSLLYSTYLGGEGPDAIQGLAVDPDGNTYLTGQTESSDFPLKDPMQQVYGGTVDAFVAKLSADGSSLIYSTFLGGSDDDRAYKIAIDSAGAAYVTGQTYSSNFPTKNPLQDTNHGNSDAFVAKLDPAGSALAFSTYLGGRELEQGLGIAVDATGAVYVSGITDSPDFPTLNAAQPQFGGTRDTFVTKLSPNGDAFVYSTYLGGSAEDRGAGVGIDATGSAYVSDYTLRRISLRRTLSKRFTEGPAPGTQITGLVMDSSRSSVRTVAHLYSRPISGARVMTGPSLPSQTDLAISMCRSERRRRISRRFIPSNLVTAAARLTCTWRNSILPCKGSCSELLRWE